MNLFSEQGQFLVGVFGTDGNAATVQGARILAVDYDEVMVCVHLRPGAGATSAQVATITVEESTLASAGTTRTLTQEQSILMNGATALTAGTGLGVRTKNDPPASTYVTLAADGLKEQLVSLPIRVRRMSSGFKYLSAKVTGLTAARIVAIYYVCNGARYGADQVSNAYA
jgi:hypothetical protein